MTTLEAWEKERERRTRGSNGGGAMTTYTRDEVEKIVSTAVRRTMGMWRDEGPEYRDNKMLQDAYDQGAATVESMVDDYFFEEDEREEAGR